VNFIKKITHNWHIKLLSLALAGILWIYVGSIQERERFLSVPIVVKNVAEGFIVSSELPDFAQLVLRGRDEYLSLINEEDVVAYIDMEKESAGESRKIVKVDRRGLPRRVSIKEIDPRLIQVRIERQLRKQVKVVPVIASDLPEGYSLEDVSIDPGTVEVQGPESLMKDTQSVYTRDINIGSLTETTVMEMNIETGDEKITLLNDAPVDVRIVVKEEFALARLADIAVFPVNLSEGLTAEILADELNVLVKIPKRLEKRFSPEKMYAQVDCEGITGPGEYELPLIFQSEIPRTTLVKIEPDVVMVRISEPPAE
jgi:YbbR domain-containing protein